jgi:hypothetical protein
MGVVWAVVPIGSSFPSGHSTVSVELFVSPLEPLQPTSGSELSLVREEQEVVICNNLYHSFKYILDTRIRTLLGSSPLFDRLAFTGYEPE